MIGTLVLVTIVNLTAIVAGVGLLEGVGIDILWPQMLGPAAIAATLLGVSVPRFRKSLD